MFTQILNPLGEGWSNGAVALVPIVVLLVCLAGLRTSAWLAVLISVVVTLWLAVAVWRAPVGDTLTAYGLGAATGVWSVDWIAFWGLVI